MYAISEDPVAPVKLFADFAKANKGIPIKAGAMPGSLLDAEGVKALADMPSRDELMAKLLGTLRAPITQFVRTLNEVRTKCVCAPRAVQERRANAQWVRN